MVTVQSDIAKERFNSFKLDSEQNYSKFAYIVLQLSLKPLGYIFPFSITKIEVIKVICVGLQGIESVEIRNERKIIEVTKVMEIIEVTVEDK